MKKNKTHETFPAVYLFGSLKEVEDQLDALLEKVFGNGRVLLDRHIFADSDEPLPEPYKLSLDDIDKGRFNTVYTANFYSSSEQLVEDRKFYRKIRKSFKELGLTLKVVHINSNDWQRAGWVSI